jgi:adenine-specific DNA-methyltransferase
VSRLTDLIAQAKTRDPQLGADLDREFKVLSSRLPFGLNFERHSPEAVELPRRIVRKGDKVRVLPERRSSKKGDQRLWQVKAIRKAGDGKMADLELLGATNSETRSVAVDDLVVIAEFRDTIYPGLVSTGNVQRGGDKPFHTVINGENYHALNALTWTHRGKIDAIYIDPPYNSGAKDWKYNNDYVEGDDLYRHSKWLAMIERRLLVAKELLNPADSVLIVSIDEKEYLRLGLLLEQVFLGCTIQMVSAVINPQGTGRNNEFSRTNEFIYFVMLGGVHITPTADNMFDRDEQEDMGVEWRNLRRRERESVRGARPNQFYAVFIDEHSGQIHSVGDPLPDHVDVSKLKAPAGTRAVFPTTPNGKEMLWGIVPERLRYLAERGYARVANGNIQFLNRGTVAGLESGTVVRSAYDEFGGVIAHHPAGTKQLMPKTVWVRDSHNSQASGTLMLKRLISDRNFPFPKSLFAVEDSIRFFVKEKPRAIILDFFAGSGTTAHAVMRLNRQDGGYRQCISVTNNEVAADEHKALREQGLRPGDAEWEKWGICDYITKPRVEAAISGRTPDGQPIKGDYKFTDEFPMSEGLKENAEFFTLTYESLIAVNYNMAFARIAPLLWLRAGSQGERIDKLPAGGWAVVETYGLLTELDKATPFVRAVGEVKEVRVAYIVTDDDRRFQAIARRLRDGIEPVRLYESYLTNFSFANGE